MLSCVRARLSQRLSLTRLTRIVGIDSACFTDLFGRAVKVSPRRCIVGRHIRQTGIVLGGASFTVTSVTLRINFSDRDRLARRFGHVAKVAPGRVHWHPDAVSARRSEERG